MLTEPSIVEKRGPYIVAPGTTCIREAGFVTCNWPDNESDDLAKMARSPLIVGTSAQCYLVRCNDWVHSDGVEYMLANQSLQSAGAGQLTSLCMSGQLNETLFPVDIFVALGTRFPVRKVLVAWREKWPMCDGVERWLMGMSEYGGSMRGDWPTCTWFLATDK